MTKVFQEFGVSVRDLDTDTSSAPFAGYKIFSLKAVVAVPINANLDAFDERLKEFEEKAGVDLRIDDPTAHHDTHSDVDDH